MKSLCLRFLLPLVLSWLAGCTSLPPRAPIAPEPATSDVADTQLARIAAAALPIDQPGLSGFRLLPEGETAFNARIALARRAQKSLDVQYYLIQNDEVGHQFLRELRDAAARGVRVRLLVDDLYTAGEDPLLEGLAAHLNVQVRLFNPLPTRAGSFFGRLLWSAHEFGRINHRMHNKLFIADGSFAVSGGRNIGDEYFMHSAAANFIDLDVLSTGPVVRELSRAFDRYWNSERVYPIASIGTERLPPDEARARFDELVGRAAASIPERPRDVLDNPAVAHELDSGTLTLTLANARVLADSPDKVAGVSEESSAQTVSAQTVRVFAAARDEVNVASPYFIPGERGMAIMRAATQANGRITLVTNSLGSTDEPMVYRGYARYRLAMLKIGVRIYELSPSLARRSGKLGNFGRSLSRLHAKAATIDRKTIFIGSLNLDARSARANTEMGLVIDSPELAATMSRLFTAGLVTGAYKLRLAPDGEHIEWVETDADGRQTVHSTEPDDDAWLRLKLWLLSPFVSDELL
ncbi:MAG TPA: phospholipase D family protein [Burkholderiaceae bacterium]|nr:phospholipase D family protein [Burkholderiaceae bacterium]